MVDKVYGGIIRYSSFGEYRNHEHREIPQHFERMNLSAIKKKRMLFKQKICINQCYRLYKISFEFYSSAT